MRISTNQLYNRAMNSMLAQKKEVTKYLQQSIDGKRVRSPSDDPVASAQIELIKQRVNNIDVLQANCGNARDALRLEEGVLSEFTLSLHRLREIQVQAGNPAMGDNERKALASEAQTLLSHLQNLANSDNGLGGYLFSGSSTSVEPITLNTAGQYVYNGDSTQRSLAVTGTLQIITNDTGDNLFMRIPNGNKVFSVSAGATPNSGTGFTTTGSVVNPLAWVPDTYTISFANNSQGQMVVMVSGATSGNVIPPSGLPDDAPLYVEKSAISFNGVEVGIEGMPVPGDTFVISPSRNESIFATTQRMVANLNKPFTSAAEKAALQTDNNQLLAQIDSAMTNVVNYHTQLGARLNQLESSDKINTNLQDICAVALKDLSEVEKEVAYTQFMIQQANLQAAQLSFVKIQGLSLFNYIGV